MNRLILGLITAVFAVASSAQAAIILRLTDIGSGQTRTIEDGDLGLLLNHGVDGIGAVGAVSWSGTLASWTINVSTGVAGIGSLDLNSVNASIAPGSLRIELTSTGNSFLGSLGLFGEIGGTTQGNVTAITWLDPSNAAFGHGGAVVNLGTSPGSPFAKSGSSGAVTSAGLYSITNQVTIVHSAGSAASPTLTSFDFRSSTVPEPTTLWSATIGLGLCAMYARRRKA